MGMLKNGGDLLDHGNLKSSVSQKSFGALTEWFLHVYSDWMIFGLTTNLLCIFRSIFPKVFLGKGVLKINSNFTGEHPCWSAVSIKLQSSFIEITLPHGFSPVNLLHILRRPFRKNTSGGLLLYLSHFLDVHGSYNC